MALADKLEGTATNVVAEIKHLRSLLPPPGLLERLAERYWGTFPSFHASVEERSTHCTIESDAEKALVLAGRIREYQTTLSIDVTLVPGRTDGDR